MTFRKTVLWPWYLKEIKMSWLFTVSVAQKQLQTSKKSLRAFFKPKWSWTITEGRWYSSSFVCWRYLIQSVTSPDPQGQDAGEDLITSLGDSRQKFLIRKTLLSIPNQYLMISQAPFLSSALYQYQINIDWVPPDKYLVDTIITKDIWLVPSRCRPPLLDHPLPTLGEITQIWNHPHVKV